MQTPRVASLMSDRPDEPVCILLAGGRGSRLFELTDATCKPAVPFGPQNRIVDFTLENVRRSGLSQVLVASQYSASSLESYLDRVWRPIFGAGLRLRRAASAQRPQRSYDGTADAVWKNMVELDAMAPREVVVLSADHIYAMDYRPMIAAHRASGAAVTIAADVVPVAQATAFGCIDAAPSGRITGFVEKPANPPTIADAPGKSLASMGIYVFDWTWLRDALARDAATEGSSRDFGHDILPRAVAEGQAQVFRAAGVDGRPFFWRDVGTLDAFRTTWLQFAADVPPCDLPQLERRMLRGFPGIDLAGSPVGSVVPLSEGQGPLERRAKGVLHGSILMPGARSAEGSRLRDAIVAPGARIPAGLVIGEDADEDARWFRRTPEGTTLVTPEMLIRREAERVRPLSIAHLPFHSRSL